MDANRFASQAEWAANRLPVPLVLASAAVAATGCLAAGAVLVRRLRAIVAIVPIDEPLPFSCTLD